MVQTLRDLGYQVPPTTADGLARGEHVDDAGAAHAFTYTEATAATGEDVQAGRWESVARGDLILLDYDFDGVWDHVGLYVGAYDALTHAVFTASDYYDTVVIADMDAYNDPFAQDVTWSQVGVRRLAYPSIEATWAPSR